MDAHPAQCQCGDSHDHGAQQSGTRRPDGQSLASGLGLAALGGGLCWAGLSAAGRSWLLAPFGLALAVTGLCAGWAAAIHLTGGEEFDDHPLL